MQKKLKLIELSASSFGKEINFKFRKWKILRHSRSSRLFPCSMCRDFMPWRTAFLDYLYEPIEAGVNLLTERLPNAEAIYFFLSLSGLVVISRSDVVLIY